MEFSERLFRNVATKVILVDFFAPMKQGPLRSPPRGDSAPGIRLTRRAGEPQADTN